VFAHVSPLYPRKKKCITFVTITEAMTDEMIDMYAHWMAFHRRLKHVVPIIPSKAFNNHLYLV